MKEVRPPQLSPHKRRRPDLFQDNIMKYIYIVLLAVIISCTLINPLEAATKPGTAEKPKDEFDLHGVELKGTVFTRTLQPIAVIRDVKSGKVDMYEVGEHIKGVKLVHIKRGEVVLEKGDTTYILALPVGGVKQPKALDFIITRVGDAFHMNRSEVDRAISKLPRLLRDIKIMPHFEKGRPSGIRLSRVREGSIFQKAGVKKGDIVKSVNGMTLNTPYQIFQAYKKFKEKKSFKVEITRDGEAVVLNYMID